MKGTWVGIVVILACAAVAAVLGYWLGPQLCEADPTFCEPEPEPTRVGYPLVPVFGVVAAILVVMGLTKVVVLTQESRKRRQAPKDEVEA